MKRLSKNKKLAIGLTLLLGMFNSKASLPCDYRVTSAITEYALEVLHVDTIVTCGFSYNIESEHSSCSYDFSDLRVESTTVTQWLLTPSTMVKVDKCLGAK